MSYAALQSHAQGEGGFGPLKVFVEVSVEGGDDVSLFVACTAEDVELCFFF